MRRRNFLVSAGIGLVLFIFLCALAYAGTDPGTPVVSSVVGASSITVGDSLRYTIRIETDKQTQIQVPVPPEKMGDFTVRSSGVNESRAWKRKTVIARYDLTAFSTGKLAIPKIAIEYKPAGSDQWRTMDVPGKDIEVVSLLEKEKGTAQLRDIEGPVSLHPRLNLLLAIVVAVICIAGIIAIVVLRRRKALVETARRIPPHVIALQQLEELQFKNLIGQGRIKEYFTEMSDIIRHYIENRFDLHAPEMTTEEFLGSVRETDKLSSAHGALLRDFLTCCDLVKFAKYSPEEKETDAVYASAYNFVDQTKEEVVPAATGADGGMQR